MKSKEINSLNKTIISELSIDELESRLQLEELDAHSEMWTGCGCADRDDWNCVERGLYPCGLEDDIRRSCLWKS